MVLARTQADENNNNKNSKYKSIALTMFTSNHVGSFNNFSAPASHHLRMLIHKRTHITCICDSLFIVCFCLSIRISAANDAIKEMCGRSRELWI